MRVLKLVLLRRQRFQEGEAESAQSRYVHAPEGAGPAF
jgi:hypothetical protein